MTRHALCGVAPRLIRRASIGAIVLPLVFGLTGLLSLPAADDVGTKKNASKPAAPKVDKPASGDRKPAKSTNRPTPAALAAEREAAAIAFAQEHHPELASLVQKLRKDNRREFDRAIRELTQARERLLRLKKQSAAQYELGLAAWKLDSRAHLLAARMTMSQDPALESELKHVLRERVDVRMQELQAEQERLENRLTKVKELLGTIGADKDAAAEKDFQRVKRTVAKTRRAVPKKPSPKGAEAANPSGTAVARRPGLPNEPTAASVASPADSSSSNQTKPKTERD